MLFYEKEHSYLLSLHIWPHTQCNNSVQDSKMISYSIAREEHDPASLSLDEWSTVVYLIFYPVSFFFYQDLASFKDTLKALWFQLPPGKETKGFLHVFCGRYLNSTAFKRLLVPRPHYFAAVNRFVSLGPVNNCYSEPFVWDTSLKSINHESRTGTSQTWRSI